MDDKGKRDANGLEPERQASVLQARRGVKRPRESGVCGAVAASSGSGLQPAPNAAVQGDASQPNQRKRLARDQRVWVRDQVRRDLPLPKFDGNPLHWARFHLTWVARTWPPITDDQNRWRLYDALSGDALNLVERDLARGTSPRIIYDKLHQRYHRVACHFAELIQKVHDATNPRPQNNLVMFLRFRDALVELIHNMHIHQMQVMMNTAQFADYLSAGLPVDAFRSWTTFFTNGDNLYGLLAFVQIKIRNLMRAAMVLDSPSDSDTDSSD